jgi:hypothetical protein
LGPGRVVCEFFKGTKKEDGYYSVCELTFRKRTGYGTYNNNDSFCPFSGYASLNEYEQIKEQKKNNKKRR